MAKVLELVLTMVMTRPLGSDDRPVRRTHKSPAHGRPRMVARACVLRPPQSSPLCELLICKMAFPMRFAQGYPVVKGREVVGLSPKPSQNLMPGWSGSLRGGAGTRAPKVQCASSIDDKRKDLKSAPGTEKPKSSTTSPTSPTNSTNSPTNSSTTNFNDAPLLEIVGVPAWVGVVGGRGIEFFWLLLVASFLNEFTNPGADILQGFEPNPEALIIATKFSLPALTVLGNAVEAVELVKRVKLLKLVEAVEASKAVELLKLVERVKAVKLVKLVEAVESC
eukprot:gene10756-17839_t